MFYNKVNAQLFLFCKNTNKEVFILATLKEIANAVGVSVGTVSRVLNHDISISVSDETKIKIFNMAEEMQYKTLKQRKINNKIENNKIRVGIV